MYEFIKAQHVAQIAKQIIDAVDGANENGRICRYPKSFSVEKIIGSTTYKAEFPIFIDDVNYNVDIPDPVGPLNEI